MCTPVSCGVSIAFIAVPFLSGGPHGLGPQQFLSVCVCVCVGVCACVRAYNFYYIHFLLPSSPPVFRFFWLSFSKLGLFV